MIDTTATRPAQLDRQLRQDPQALRRRVAERRKDLFSERRRDRRVLLALRYRDNQEEVEVVPE